jgi:hypothetical protein
MIGEPQKLNRQGAKNSRLPYALVFLSFCLLFFLASWRLGGKEIDCALISL